MFDVIFSDLLQKRNISAYKLAKDTGLDNGLISKWKSGSSKPTSDMLIKLSKYFNVTTDYLLGQSDNPTPAVQSIPVLTKHEQEIIDILNQFKGDEQIKFIGEVRHIARDIKKELQSQLVGEKNIKIA